MPHVGARIAIGRSDAWCDQIELWPTLLPQCARFLCRTNDSVQACLPGQKCKTPHHFIGMPKHTDIREVTLPHTRQYGHRDQLWPRGSALHRFACRLHRGEGAVAGARADRLRDARGVEARGAAHQVLTADLGLSPADVASLRARKVL